MDFNLKTYKQLLGALVVAGYDFISIKEYISTNKAKYILLRHDVEARYENALRFAEIQSEIGITGTYYFRILKKYYEPEIVEKIASLGHEIGYHYDDLSYCKGDYTKAIERFQYNLELLRKIVPVHAICMDGSPLSKYDNKALWKKYDYKGWEIMTEPYFDIDFNKVFYFTDTSRRWDGWKTSVRDKVPQQEQWAKQGLVFHSTKDIIKAAKEQQLPAKVMMTFHPQRWNDKLLPWIKELVIQNIKNQVKKVLVRRR